MTDIKEVKRVAARDPVVVTDLDEIECFAILGRQARGRLALIEENELNIFPVEYSLDGNWVVLRVPIGLSLDQVNLGRLALEVDELEGDGECTVVVQGPASEITEGLDEASVRERRTLPESPCDNHRARWLRILPRVVTGRHSRVTSS